LTFAVISHSTAQDDPVEYNAPYRTTPVEIVERMLDLARVQRGDVVYDLGSGDGRIVITAAKKYGVRAVGLELDPELVRESQAKARAAGVGHLTKFYVQDIFTADFSSATVVTMYLLPEANLLLRPKLERQLRPGARIVSHDFGMGDWEPVDVREISDANENFYTLYLWRIPDRADDPRKGGTLEAPSP
jgi:cyclopropane fatty-acyl-phospholipid synthase-like methyltransferase